MREATALKPVDALVYVDPRDAPNLWPRIEQYVQDANNYGGGKFRLHDWLVKVLIGQADLFVSPDLESAVICEPFSYPVRNVYCIILLGGEGGHDWASYQSTLEEAAAKRGCDCLEAFGRPGWKNIMKDQDYEIAHWVWRKEL